MMQKVFTGLQNHDKNLYFDTAFNRPFLFIVCFETVLDSDALSCVWAWWTNVISI